jgi:very-short-patch-repair endonuclease
LAEKLLWARLRNGQLRGFKFRRQFPIGEFITDFACSAVRLVTELDGAQHIEQAGKDEWRTHLLAEYGYRVIRFWNDEVTTNIEGVLEKILAESRVGEDALTRLNCASRGSTDLSLDKERC